MPSHKDAEFIWSFECRQCREQRMLITEDVVDAENFHFVQKCVNCDYLNVLERAVIPLPLDDAINSLSLECQEEIRRGGNLRPDTSYLRTLVKAMVRDLAAWVADDIPAATAGLHLVMAERERALLPVLNNKLGTADTSADLHAKIVSRVSDLLYLLLACHGKVRLSGKPSTAKERGGSFLRRFFVTASNACVIALQINAVDGGMWKLSVQNGTLCTEKTDLHSRMAEWDMNRRAFENFIASGKTLVDLEEALTQETLEAQRAALGFDTMDIVQVTKDEFGKLRSDGGMRWIDSTLAVVDVEHLTEQTKRLLRPLVFTLSHTLRFTSPFYFDFGVLRRGSVSQVEAISHALGANWSNYYPFYELADDKGQLLWVTTKTPLLISLANLVSFRNRLFQRIFEWSRGPDVDQSTKKALLRAEGSRRRRLEDAVAKVVTAAGWSATIRLTKWKGKRLPFGDIDLMACKCIDNAVLILLGEIKDFDIPVVSRRGALDQLSGQIQGAFDQLAARLTWVRTAWEDGLGEMLVDDVGGSGRVFLLPLVITARYLPPFLFDRFLGMPFDGLTVFLDQIATYGLSKYRTIAGGTIVQIVG